MFLLEGFFTSHGLLSLAGLAALLLGSLFLFRTDQAYIEVSKSLVFTSFAVVAFFVLFVFFYLIQERKKQRIPKDFYSLVGKEGHVVQINPTTEDGFYFYQIRVAGEIWHAKSQQVFQVGEKCTIKGDSKGMLLKI